VLLPAPAGPSIATTKDELGLAVMLLVFSRPVCPRGSAPVACLVVHLAFRKVYRRPACHWIYPMPSRDEATIRKAGRFS
jgi:hypothetical protein